MPSASDINAGGAVVSIGGDASSLNSVLSQAQSKLQAFGSAVGNIGLGLGAGAAAIGALGAAIVAPFAAGLASLQEVAPGIARAARITGLSFEQVQDMAAGARISFEDMPGVIQKMSASIVDARNPTSQMARDFAELGLNINALNGQDAQGQLAMIADALSNVTDEARRMDLARNILGRSGAGINLSGGAAGINARAERNREIGGFLSNNDVRAGLDFARAQNELKIASVGLSRVLGAVLAPVMTWIAETTLTVVMAVRGWVDRNRALLAIVARFGVFLGFLATILGSVAAAMVSAGMAIGFLAPAGAMIAKVIGVLLGVFVAILPYLVSIGLAVLAVWGIMEIFGTTIMDIWNLLVGWWNAIIQSVDWISVLTVVLSPLIVLFGVLAGAVYGLWALFDSIDWGYIAEVMREAFWLAVDYVVSAVRWIYESVLSVYNWIVSAFPTMFGYISSGIGLAVEGVMVWFGVLRTFVSDGIDTLMTVFGDLTAAFGGIGDAINAGDWSGAFEIGLGAILLIWERTKNWLLNGWYDFQHRFLTAWDATLTLLGPLLIPVVQGVVLIFFALIQGIQDGLNMVIAGINRAARLLPERVRPAVMESVDFLGNAPQNTVDAIANALTPSETPRVRQQVDRTRERELEAQQAALVERAALDAWIAQEQAAIQSGGGVGRSQSGQSAMQFGSSMGAFSAAALSQVGSGNYAERTANAVEAMVPGINRVGDLLENDEGGVFQ